MKLIPFDANWLDSGTKDLMAVYRRPRTQAITGARLSDEQGRPQWDYSNLPIRRHNDWLKKGYQYVTLARVSDLIAVKERATPELLACYGRSGEPEERTFDIQAYLKHAVVEEDVEFEKLRALVHQVGSDAVIAVNRSTNPHFELPEALRGIPPGGQAPTPTLVAPQDRGAPLTSDGGSEKPKGSKKKPEPVQA